EEIADRLGRPRKTVQTQLYRARLKLQKMIKEEMQVERNI
ncbi:MAG: RNA polymerase subunit sigma-70, partial [Oscillospiraceae bacterium]|nr:RNA polymerase subunit sigma-70 [Oscillospiraceae bacterium]